MFFAPWIQPTVSNDRWIEKNRKNEKMREVAWIFEIYMKSVKWQKVILRVNDFVHSIPTPKIESKRNSVDLETIEKKKWKQTKNYTSEKLNAAPSDT